jgi:spermidine synthase
VIALIFGQASSTMLVTTLLLGAMFPLVAKTVVDSLGQVSRRIGTVYVGNTLGSIAGSLVVGFGLLPLLGLRGSFLALVALNLCVGVAVTVIAASRDVGRAVAVAGAAALGLAFLVVPPRLFESQYATRFGTLRFYREDVTDTVMVTEAKDGSRMIRYGDGRGTAGTPTVVGDRMYAHIPMLLHPAPRKVLQICFGVGNSLSSVLQYPVERVDAVELSPSVIAAAPYFEATNRGSIDDPRVHLTINDGRNFLLASRERYDVIRLDPPELHTAGIVNLYTLEFYEMARDHLAEGGIFSIWFNGVMTPTEDIRAVLRTAAAAFPYVSVWHDPYMFSWVVNGSMSPHDPDLLTLQSHFADDAVRRDLESIEIPDPFHFLSHFVFAGDQLNSWAGEGPLVVDDHTRIDFSVPRSSDSSYGIANFNTNNWLVQLLEPGSKHDVAFATFVRKASELASYKRSVLPSVRNIEAAGFSREDVAKRIQAAPASSRAR